MRTLRSTAAHGSIKGSRINKFTFCRSPKGAILRTQECDKNGFKMGPDGRARM
jgi:hypothetical protein